MTRRYQHTDQWFAKQQRKLRNQRILKITRRIPKRTKRDPRGYTGELRGQPYMYNLTPQLPTWYQYFVVMENG